MDDTQFQELDLNLLRSLSVLLDEQNVTRAARRMGITQPAMSHALRRLRESLGDPLLVRTGNRLQLTERARALQQPLRRVLRDIATILRAETSFEPSQTRRSFSVAASDYSQFILLPPLVATLAHQAPGCRVRAHNLDRHPLDALADDSIDLVIDVTARIPEVSGLMRQVLYEDEFSCLLRTGHPALDKEFDLDSYLALEHLLIAPHGKPGSWVDVALGGSRRHIAVSVSSFLVAPFLIGSTDRALTMPSRIAGALAEHLDVVVLRPPLSLPPIRIAQIWHQRWQDDPAHIWFRRCVLESCAKT